MELNLVTEQYAFPGYLLSRKRGTFSCTFA